MNKRLIITIAIFTILVVIAASITAFLLSFKGVTFTFKKPELVAGIYKSDDTERKNKIAEVKNNETIRLQEGNYAAVPTGDNFDRAPTYFSVNKEELTVTVDAGYSTDYLASRVPVEQPAITAALTKAYPIVASSFDIATGKLYKEAEWYATTLTQHPEDPRDQGDIYYVIMLKKDDTWTVVGKPSLVLTTAEFKDVPADILKDANRLGQ